MVIKTFYSIFVVVILLCGLEGVFPRAIQHSEESCGHVPEKRVVFDVNLEQNVEPHVIRKRSASQPLRIKLYYDNSLSSLPSSHTRLIQKLVRQAVDYWERTLLVRPTNGPIRLNRQCISDDVTYRYGTPSRYCVNGCAPVTRCGDIYIPPEHLEQCYFWNSYTGLWRNDGIAGAGVSNHDFILYVAALSTGRCRRARTIAYAAHCQQEAALDRPVAGYFSICPESISVQKQDHLQLLSTLKHEILHALGFSAGLFAFYHDSNGIPLTPRKAVSNKPEYNHNLNLYQWSDKVVRGVARSNWKVRAGYITKFIYVMVTPRVLAEVRRHFNCPTLEGAELEDQGVVGTNLTHWEKRIFENEAMTGTYTQNPVISRITLAMMEDTGWYRALYDNAEDLEWGKNLGCDFVMKSCLEWLDINRAGKGDIHPFCDHVRQGMLKTDCTRNGKAVAFCNLVEYNQTLPPQYQYFSHLDGIPRNVNPGKFGGSVALADYCPYLQEFAWRSGTVNVRDSRCTLPINNPDPRRNFFGEKYASDSRCFQHDRMWQLKHCSTMLSLSHWGSGCYQYHCSSTEGLVIYVGDRSYPCQRAGQRLSVAYTSYNYLHKGSIICPSCTEVCKNSGIRCPPDRQPYNVISALDNLEAPCGAAASQLASVFTVVIEIFVIKKLIFICLYCR